MESKPCSLCSRPATYSLAVLLSTVGRRPRLQKCSKSILLCTACIHDWIALGDIAPLSELHQPLQSAYTEIAGDTSGDAISLNRPDSAVEAHQGSASEVSSRPCLIAGNSRHYDELFMRSEASHDR